jgi:hypothetical protein
MLQIFNNIKTIQSTRGIHSRIVRYVTCICFILTIFAQTIIFDSKTVDAAINQQINYQGKLMNSVNQPVADGTYTIVFKLYNAPTGGTALWTETRSGGNKVQVTRGLFSVLLGEITALSGIDWNQTLYLGVTIESDSEMTPRKKFGAVPHRLLH